MQPRPETSTELWCGPCKQMHPRSAFGKDRNSPNGLAYACKDVVKRRNSDYHARNRAMINDKNAERRAARKAAPDSDEWAIKNLVSDAARRARAKGLKFGINAVKIPRPTHCPLLGLELVYQADVRRLPNSASIDRIDSSKGYVPGNVWIISWRANQIKSDATLDELETIAASWRTLKAGRFLDGVQHDGRPEA